MITIKEIIDERPKFTPVVVGYLQNVEKIILGTLFQKTAGSDESPITETGGRIIDFESAENALERVAQSEIMVKLLI